MANENEYITNIEQMLFFKNSPNLKNWKINIYFENDSTVVNLRIQGLPTFI